VRRRRLLSAARRRRCLSPQSPVPESTAFPERSTVRTPRAEAQCEGGASRLGSPIRSLQERYPNEERPHGRLVLDPGARDGSRFAACNFETD
jgi:hypothetical protein